MQPPHLGAADSGPAANPDREAPGRNRQASRLMYSTYLGGSGTDQANGIAVDGSANAYVTGYTDSTNFPTTNPLQASNGGGAGDAFVTKINAAGSTKVYFTYLAAAQAILAWASRWTARATPM